MFTTNMKYLIIDDNPMARAVLRQLASGIDDLNLVSECTSALEAFNCLQKEPVDLLLLDVEMPEMSGIELIQSLPTRPWVILITSKTDYAAEAFDLNVVDYIVKPVTLPRFMSAMQKVQEIQNSQQNLIENSTEKDYLFVRAEGALIKIRFDDLLWVQALVDYVQFITVSGKKYTVHATLKAVEKHLNDARFVRSHRSYIVNVDKIDKIEEGVTIVIGKEGIPISEQYKQAVNKQLNLL
jgi:two-component system, LytTR family, response regulator